MVITVFVHEALVLFNKTWPLRHSFPRVSNIQYGAMRGIDRQGKFWSIAVILTGHKYVTVYRTEKRLDLRIITFLNLIE